MSSSLKPAGISRRQFLIAGTAVGGGVLVGWDSAGTLQAIWWWIVLSVIGVFVIAAVSIGVVSSSLAQRPRRSVYDLLEAVDFVADRLGQHGGYHCSRQRL